jgi:hypothetical protein
MRLNFRQIMKVGSGGGLLDVRLDFAPSWT